MSCNIGFSLQSYLKTKKSSCPVAYVTSLAILSVGLFPVIT